MPFNFRENLLKALKIAFIIGVFCVAIGTAQVAARGANKNCGIANIAGFALNTVENLIYFKHLTGSLSCKSGSKVKAMIRIPCLAFSIDDLSRKFFK
jgi:heme/copper-type cytochrome/quinol oxidase subunit 4